jgi:hypothetical protein
MSCFGKSSKQVSDEVDEQESAGSFALGIGMGKVIPKHIYKECKIDRQSLREKYENDWFKCLRKRDIISKFFE